MKQMSKLLLLIGFGLISVYNVYSQTFSANYNTSIPDNDIVTGLCKTITVSSVGVIDGTYGLESVCIYVTHTWDADLDIYLTAPDGTRVELTTDNGSDGDNYGSSQPGDCCFYMTASTNVTAGTAPFVGSYKPEGNLGYFNNGQNADGGWTLCVYDDASGDTGKLRGFSLTFSSSPATPVTPTCSDGIQNQGETGIDCGGPCTACGVGTTCANPNVISSVPYTNSASTCGAGDDYSSSNACLSSYMNGDDYVYEYTPVTTQTVSVSLTSDATWVGVFVTDGCPDVGSCVASGTSSGSSAQISSISLTAGNTYNIIVSTYPSPQCISNFTINITPSVPPSNDDPCTAQSLTVATSCSYSTYSNLNASGSSVADPGCASYLGGDVWFTAVVPASGNLKIDTDEGVMTDGGMALYSGSNCSSLTLISCDDESSANGSMPMILLTGRTPGETIWIRVWEYGNDNNGTFGICAEDPQTVIQPNCSSTDPAGDHCSTATPICDINGYCGNTSSTYDGDAPAIFCAGSVDNTSWLSFIATATSATLNVWVANCEYAWGVQIEVYSTSDCINYVSKSNCWNPGVEENGVINATGLTPGNTYYMLVDGYAGDVCDYTISAGSGVMVADAISVESGSDVAFSCGGQTNHLLASGGTSYVWSPAATLSNPNIANPIATPSTTTTYYVTVTGGNPDCPASVVDSVKINVYDLSTQTTISTTNETCTTGNDGTATITMSGTTAPYTYLWDANAGNQTTASISGLSAGTYSVTITDNTSCSSVQLVTVNGTTPPSASISSQTNVLCNGGSNGAATVSASGGSGGYTYLWNDPAPVQTTATATGLTAGTYGVTVTDSNGCTGTTSVTITQPSALSSVISNTDANCYGSGDGSVSVTPSGGTTPYTYLWNDAGFSTTQTVTGLGAGNYAVTITDSHNCTTTNAVTISQPASMSITVTSTSSSCGNPDGSATATISGGISPYDYEWSNSSTTLNSVSLTNTINSVNSDSYSVTVTDNNNCTITGTVNVADAGGPTINSSSQVNLTCNGSNNGSATVEITGGSTPFDYDWSGTLPDENNSASTSSTVSNLAAGNYTVVITDNNNCSTSQSYTITQPPVLNASITSQTNVNCFGQNTGAATVSISGGTSDYDYNWSGTLPDVTNTTSLSNTVTNLPAGTYSVTVTDNNSCTKTVSVTISEPALLTASIGSFTNVDCNGNITGSATAIVSGGTLNYTYLWSSGGNGLTENGLADGIYTFTVTDNYNCTASTSVTISEPAVLSASVTSSNNIDCNGNSNGNATVSVIGGTTPYSYLWSNSNTGLTISNVVAGTYGFTVTDNHGCQNSTSVVITQPAILNVAVSAVSAVRCFNGNDGSAAVSVSGGTTPYIYNWSSGSSASNAPGLTAGTYSVTVTDNNGCEDNTSVTITQPNALSVSLTETTPVSCFGEWDAALSASVSGGTAPFDYLWSSGGILMNETGLNAGTYYITISDLYNCEITSSIVVSEPALLTATISSFENVSCNGLSDGSAQVVVAGGTSSYSYLWSNGATNNSVTDFSAGTYSVVVTDSHNCQANANVTITEPDILALPITVTDATCGNADGSATVNPTGGTTPYGYLWSNSITANAISSVDANIYSVTVTDANGCSDIAVANINDLGAPILSLSSKTNVLCFGGNDGSATINVAGGTSPFTYTWSSGGSGLTENNLIAGTYTFVVEDANTCVSSMNVTITQPTNLTVSMSNISNVSCFGQNDGGATVTISGGVSPYTILWSNGGNAVSKNDLAAGNYEVTVTDNNGCEKTTTFTITESDVLSASVVSQTNISCNGLSNGSVQVDVNGGTTSYSYIWDNAAVTQNLSNVPAGIYTLTVTDAHNCQAIVSATVTEPASLSSGITSQTNVSCYGYNDGTAEVTAGGGTTPYTYLWTNGNTNSIATGLDYGIHNVTVTDSNGCTSISGLTISQPGLLTSSFTNTNNVSCFGLSDGTAEVTATGGTTPYSYVWSNAETTQSINSLTANSYSVSITDNNGCETVNTIVITEPLLLQSNIINLVNVSCNGLDDGSAEVNVTGGTTSYVYQWSNGSVTNTSGNLAPGNYDVTVTDLHGCQTVSYVTITEPAPLTLSVSITDANCGNSDGSATVTATGGTTPYSYNWNNGSLTNTISSVSSGSYAVIVSDSNNCSEIISAVISDIGAATLTVLSQTNATCFGSSDGSVTIALAGGTSPFNYTWSSGGNGLTESNLAAGVYTLNVVDINLCSSTIEVTITQPAELIVSTSNITNVSCFGGNDGSAEVTITGGISPYSVEWNDGTTTAVNSGLSAGVYSVTATDNNNCKSSINVTITEPAVISLNTVVTDATTYGGCDGTATVNITGGTAPYSFLWSDPSNQTGNPANNLCAGVYSVTVTDNNGCTSVTSVTIDQPQIIEASITSVTNPECFGYCNGTASVTVTVGQSPFAYTWSDSNSQTTQTAVGLCAGTYSVTVTDANNTSAILTTTITEPVAVTPQTTILNTNLCYGDSTASVTVNVSQGVPPYSYAWSNGSFNQTITGLATGIYNVTVTDNNNCVGTASASVTQPDEIVVQTSDITQVKCYGDNTGSATLTVSGGTPPYTYLWSNSVASNSITNVNSGNYTLSVSDANTCMSEFYITISQPASALSSLISEIDNVSCNGLQDGSAHVIVTGGTSPYTYLWSDGSTSAISTNLGSGTFNVTMTDYNSCTIVNNVIITEPSALEIDALPIDVSCKENSDGAVDITITGGTPDYSFVWSTGATTEDISNLISGSYTVTVYDNNLCSLTESFEISASDVTCLEIPSTFTPNDDGYNDKWKIRYIELFPEAVIEIYNRWGILLYQSDGVFEGWDGIHNGNPLPMGAYTYIITLNNGTDPITGVVTIIR